MVCSRLMLYAGARRAARRNADGDYVPLSKQDPALWDAAAIDEAETAVAAGQLPWPDRAVSARGGGAVGAYRAADQ